ncbi:hypothetical protein C8R45DRAFT_975889 [Mycena sanguinolenta]|nr:hypothetical protein C8R45DRAFT_975889 [Mycena sanguinolenta]
MSRTSVSTTVWVVLFPRIQANWFSLCQSIRAKPSTEEIRAWTILDRAGTLLLCQICSAWRAIALRTPALYMCQNTLPVLLCTRSREASFSVSPASPLPQPNLSTINRYGISIFEISSSSRGVTGELSEIV